MIPVDTPRGTKFWVHEWSRDFGVWDSVCSGTVGRIDNSLVAPEHGLVTGRYCCYPIAFCFLTEGEAVMSCLQSCEETMGEIRKHMEELRGRLR